MKIKLTILFLFITSLVYGEQIFPFGKEADGNTKYVVTGSTTMFYNTSGNTVTANSAYFMEFHAYRPYASFSDSTTQTWTSSTLAYPISHNTVESNSGDFTHSTIVLAPRFTIKECGVYKILFSAILKPATPADYANIWLRVNGNDVVRSNTKMQLPNASQNVMTVEYLYKFCGGDYWELVGNGTNGMQLIGVAEQAANPHIPATPSIITTIAKVSE